MKKFIKNNSRSLAFLILFFISFARQIYCGVNEHNKELIVEGGEPIKLLPYLLWSHSIEATF